MADIETLIIEVADRLDLIFAKDFNGRAYALMSVDWIGYFDTINEVTKYLDMNGETQNIKSQQLGSENIETMNMGDKREHMKMGTPKSSKLKPYNELYNFIHENNLKLVVTVKGHITLERYTESREASTKISEFNEKYYAAIKSLVDNFLNTSNMQGINTSSKGGVGYSSFTMKYPELFDAETNQPLIEIPCDDWEYERYVDTIDDIKLLFESDYFQIHA